jgi:hypothetical protein
MWIRAVFLSAVKIWDHFSAVNMEFCCNYGEEVSKCFPLCCFSVPCRCICPGSYPLVYNPHDLINHHGRGSNAIMMHVYTFSCWLLQVML